MWRVIFQQNPTLHAMSARLSRHPGWVWRTALLCAVLTIVIPLLLLALAGLLVGVVVFCVLALVARVMEMLGISGRSPTTTAPEAMRRNVRVIDEDGI